MYTFDRSAALDLARKTFDAIEDEPYIAFVLYYRDELGLGFPVSVYRDEDGAVFDLRTGDELSPSLAYPVGAGPSAGTIEAFAYSSGALFAIGD